MNEIKALSEKLGKQLIELGWTITTAESCTGGAISSAITDIAGSSAYFERSFITYSNEAKSEMLGIPLETINANGAVSAEVVEAMATGAITKANANLAIAVSGIAGPGGGTKDKPVGTVYLAVAIQYILDGLPKNTVEVVKLNLKGDRSSIRMDTIKFSLIKVLELLKEKN